jgi:hypothetical protein
MGWWSPLYCLRLVPAARRLCTLPL